MPESIRNNKVLFIANLVVVFTIGLLGNILILLALPYAWVSYKKSFPGVLDFQYDIFSDATIRHFPQIMLSLLWGQIVPHGPYPMQL